MKIGDNFGDRYTMSEQKRNHIDNYHKKYKDVLIQASKNVGVEIQIEDGFCINGNIYTEFSFRIDRIAVFSLSFERESEIGKKFRSEFIKISTYPEDCDAFLDEILDGVPDAFLPEEVLTERDLFETRKPCLVALPIGHFIIRANTYVRFMSYDALDRTVYNMEYDFSDGHMTINFQTSKKNLRRVV